MLVIVLPFQELNLKSVIGSLPPPIWTVTAGYQSNTNPTENLIETTCNTVCRQEKMRGQRGRLPVQTLGYVMSTKVIFRRVEVFVLAEVCLPRRPHAGQPRADL